MTRKKRFSAFTLAEALAVLGTNQSVEWVRRARYAVPAGTFRAVSHRLEANMVLGGLWRGTLRACTRRSARLTHPTRFAAP